jgi:4-hydroxyphenylpyruvate dioxygenase
MTDAPRKGNLGLIGWDHYEYVFADLESGRVFLEQQMDLPETGRLSSRASGERGEDALFYRAGRAALACVVPTDPESPAGKWLRRHPEGVRRLAFRVHDLDFTRRTLAERGATFRTGTVAGADQQGQPYRYFDIATPMGDVTYRFVQRGPGALPPGIEPVDPSRPGNRYAFQVIDHVTSNFLTLEPFVTWLRDVMGFTEYWRVSFHTSDAKGDGGTGLFSIVMWDRESGIKMANNEPLAPNYEGSQIYAFVEENHGPGVQHVAFHVPDILPCVEGLRRSGVEFLDTPGAYYDMLPGRMASRGVSALREDERRLRELGILVDGQEGKYLLQIFSVEGRMLRHRPEGGPFFYEIIQRRGARGFGEGNFRALFESIEREREIRGGAPAAPNPWSGT